MLPDEPRVPSGRQTLFRTAPSGVECRRLTEDMRHGVQMTIRQGRGFDRTEIPPGNIEPNRVVAPGKHHDKHLVSPIACTLSPRSETFQVKERGPLTLGHHVVRALCLLLGRLDLLARLRRLDRPYHQLPAKIGVRQDRLHVDTVIPGHRFPPSA